MTNQSKITTLQKLQQQLPKQYQSNFINDDMLRIEIPQLDLMQDQIIIYIEKINDQQFQITDDGFIYDDLKISRPNQINIIKDRLNDFNDEIKDEAIVSPIYNDEKLLNPTIITKYLKGIRNAIDFVQTKA